MEILLLSVDLGVSIFVYIPKYGLTRAILHTIEVLLVVSSEVDVNKAAVVAEGDLGLWEGASVRDRLIIGDASNGGTVGDIQGWSLDALNGSCSRCHQEGKGGGEEHLEMGKKVERL